MKRKEEEKNAAHALDMDRDRPDRKDMKRRWQKQLREGAGKWIDDS